MKKTMKRQGSIDLFDIVFEKKNLHRSLEGLRTVTHGSLWGELSSQTKPLASTSRTALAWKSFPTCKDCGWNSLFLDKKVFEQEIKHNTV